MNAPQIMMRYEDDVGRLEISGEVTQALALTIEAAINKLFGYLRYERVAFRINSPGGELVALAHILQCIDHWRGNGKEIHTEGLFQIASAAALLLALGEVGGRTVHRHSSILFHHTRIAGSTSAITAGSASRIAAVLRRTDLGLVKRVVCHVENGLGGIPQLCSEGLARCAMLRQNAAEISMALNIAPSGRSPRWLSSVAAAYRECDQKITTLPYQRYLEKRFEQETEMDIPEAYALNLIDCVYGLPMFSPVSKANDERLAAPPLRLAA